MKKVKLVYFFENGTVAAIDELGNQIQELQHSLVDYWVVEATRLGYDVANVSIKTPSVIYTLNQDSIDCIVEQAKRDGRIKTL